MTDLVGEHRSDRRRDHPSSFSPEQLLPEPGFERGDVSADRAVGETELFRRRRIAAGPRSDLEDPQGIERRQKDHDR